MKKLLILFFFFFFAFLFYPPLLGQNKAEAIQQQAAGLGTETTCEYNSSSSTNDISTIIFTWHDGAATSVNYKYVFWKTGDTSETEVSRSTYCSSYSCRFPVKNLPDNKTYNWYVKTVDAGFCLWDCSAQIDGPQVTSAICPPPANTTPKYSCNSQNWTCSQSLNGAFGDLSSCTAACKAPTPQAYNCANRKPECTTAQYPGCIDYPFSSNWECKVPPNCAMNYRVGSDTTKWTNSCAFNKDQPANSCLPLGSTTCSGIGAEQGDCCANLICQPQGGNTISLGDGTCVQGSPSLGGSCFTCNPGVDTWSDALNSCVDSSGNKTNPVASVYCSATQACIQGWGCKENLPDCNIVGACDKPGEYNLGCSEDGCDTAIGRIIPNAKGLIRGLFAVGLSLSGALAVILIIISGYRLIASQGNPEKVKAAQEQLTAAIIGLLFVVFSIAILETIGVDILGLPGVFGE